MSTAFHPQTDGQTERLNQTIEAYLRAFVSHEQDNWVSLLPMAEFGYNNSVTIGNGMSPFYANYGFHPVTLDPPDNEAEPLNPASTIYAHWMRAVHEESRKGLEAAQERMRRYADSTRKEPPAYQIGDLVMLNGRNIKTHRPTKKLWTTRIIVLSKSRKWYPRSPPTSRCLGSGRFTMSSIYHCSSPIELASTEPGRTRQRYSEKRTTSSKARNTILRKLCRHESTANGSSTSSDGSTIQSEKTGRRNHSTTSR